MNSQGHFFFKWANSNGRFQSVIIKENQETLIKGRLCLICNCTHLPTTPWTFLVTNMEFEIPSCYDL